MIKKPSHSWVATAILLAAIGWLLAGKAVVYPQYDASETSLSGGQGTASLLHFTLGQMVDNADKVFRGTVVDFESGTVPIAEAELPAITYRLIVTESFKGFDSPKDSAQYTEITMLGSVKKAPAQGELEHLSALPTPPLLQVGNDYLLLMTDKSAVGLSSPVGLGQGSFAIHTLNKEEWAVNAFNNAGLFDGPAIYSELAAQIEQEVRD